MERTLPDEGQGLPRPDTGLKSIASDGPLQDLALWRKDIVNVKMKRNQKVLYILNFFLLFNSKSPWAKATEAMIRRMTAFMLDVDSGLSVQVCNSNN